jgi:hypothetical protein
VVQALYYCAFPASSLQGTPGKKLLGLRITDMDDQGLTIFQSALRYLFQQFWLIVGIPLTFIGVSNSPYAALLPFVADCFSEGCPCKQPSWELQLAPQRQQNLLLNRVRRFRGSEGSTSPTWLEPRSMGSWFLANGGYAFHT